MAWDAYVRTEALPEYAAALATLALALWLLWLDARRLANATFAAFLLVRAAGTFAFTLERLAPAPQDELLWDRLRAVTTILTVATVLLFVAAYPEERRRAPGRTVAALAGLAALVVAAYAVQPSLWATYRIEGGELQHATIGPLFVFQLARVPVVGIAAWVFALSWSRAPRAPNAGALLTVALAFGLYAAYDAANATTLLLSQGAGSVQGWALAEYVVDVLTFLPVGAAAWALGRGRLSRTQKVDARRARLALLLPVATNAFVLLLLVTGLEAPGGATALFFQGVWRLSLPLLVTYALVRHALFDLDVKIKRTLRRVVVAGLFFLVFFAVEQGGQQLLQDRAGPAIGGLAAAFLALGLSPLEKVADRVTDAAMPHVESVRELRRDDREALYRELARSAWASGRVTPDERRLLDVAGRRLGLRAEQRERLETRVRPRNARKGT